MIQGTTKSGLPIERYYESNEAEHTTLEQVSIIKEDGSEIDFEIYTEIDLENNTKNERITTY